MSTSLEKQSSLPPAFVERLQQLFDEKTFESILQSFQITKPICVRHNPLQIEHKKFLDELKALLLPHQALPDIEGCVLIPAEEKIRLTHSEFYNQGYCYIQAPASLLPALCLAPQPGEEVLDLCSAPGSKTTQIAALMQNEGRIAAVEKSRSRFFKLKANLKKQKASCVDTYLKDGRIVWRYCENRFDRVLIDAPCSSEGRFRLDHPDSYEHWSEKKVKQMAHLQKALLISGFRCLKPGGRLIYSTCTLSPEENEAVVDHLLQQLGEQVIIEPIDLPQENLSPGITEWRNQSFTQQVEHSRRVLPNSIYDSFFLCQISKKH
jgi:16S rRNA (cytosine1407-C5)-methyltransferase